MDPGGAGLGTPIASSPVPLYPPQSTSLQILTVWMFGGTANLKSPTLRIPPSKGGGGCQSAERSRFQPK
ncbi:hypothetical protein [Haloquadratum walsbyi]|uniref:hypothetical protein n=1 Tax=Haloquadratum walsbyi TaxID=293091 RepID=UPI0026F0A994|nr:hypothetical protein [Haloquadratum walsbyi]